MIIFPAFYTMTAVGELTYFIHKGAVDHYYDTVYRQEALDAFFVGDYLFLKWQYFWISHHSLQKRHCQELQKPFSIYIYHNDNDKLLSKHFLFYFIILLKWLSVIRSGLEQKAPPGSCSLISVINSVHVDDKKDVITANVCAHKSRCSSATHQQTALSLSECHRCSDASCLMRPNVSKSNSHLAWNWVINLMKASVDCNWV